MRCLLTVVLLLFCAVSLAQVPTVTETVTPDVGSQMVPVAPLSPVSSLPIARWSEGLRETVTHSDVHEIRPIHNGDSYPEHWQQAPIYEQPVPIYQQPAYQYQLPQAYQQPAQFCQQPTSGCCRPPCTYYYPTQQPCYRPACSGWWFNW